MCLARKYNTQSPSSELKGAWKAAEEKRQGRIAGKNKNRVSGRLSDYLLSKIGPLIFQAGCLQLAPYYSLLLAPNCWSSNVPYSHKVSPGPLKRHTVLNQKQNVSRSDAEHSCISVCVRHMMPCVCMRVCSGRQCLVTSVHATLKWHSHETGPPALQQVHTFAVVGVSTLLVADNAAERRADHPFPRSFDSRPPPLEGFAADSAATAALRASSSCAACSNCCSRGASSLHTAHRCSTTAQHNVKMHNKMQAEATPTELKVLCAQQA